MRGRRPNLSRMGEELAWDHWRYTDGILTIMCVSAREKMIASYLYRKAMEHGYKHGYKDGKKGRRV